MRTSASWAAAIGASMLAINLINVVHVDRGWQWLIVGGCGVFGYLLGRRVRA